VYIDVSGALLEAIKIIFRDEVWIQSIDYEHIPFQCGKFHEHGHLFGIVRKTKCLKTLSRPTIKRIVRALPEKTQQIKKRRKNNTKKEH